MSYDPHNIDELEPAYLAAYGLHQAPFASITDDRFFYANPSLAEHVELLRHYIQYGNLLLMVTGDHGIGKTTLKQHVIQSAPPEWQICDIPSHTMMDASQLLRQVAQGFAINQPPLEADALLEVLANQFAHYHSQGDVPILMIDDAHALPLDALQSLFYLAEHHNQQESSLRIILFCEPVIHAMLDDPAIHNLKERITHTMELQPLDENDTAEYLRHRLAVAGFDGTSPFTPRLIHKIHKASQGIPAKINQLAHQNLLDDSEPALPVEETVHEALIQETSPLNLRNMLMGGFALAAVITVLLFQDQINPLFEAPPPQTDTSPAVPPPPPADTALPEVAAEVTTAPQQTIEINLDQPPANKPEPDAGSKPASPAVTTTEPRPEKPALPALQLDGIQPNPVTASKQRQIISVSGKGFRPGQQVRVTWRGHEKILSANQVTISNDHFMNLILNVGSQPDDWSVTVIDPEQQRESNTLHFKVVAATPAAASKPATDSKKTTPAPRDKPMSKGGTLAWLQQQADQHYTLQLLASHRQQPLTAYRKKYQLDKARIVPTRRKGEDWYVLILGSYTDKAAAKTAAAQLPAGINKPWIRNFAGIKQSLAKAAPTTTTTPILQSDTRNASGWLWSQDPRHFTLQLAAGTNKAAIEAFVRRHRLQDKAVYFHRRRNGQDWYILVYGSFASRATAKAAIDRLPAALQKAKPWPRPFSAIHAELN